MGGRLSGSRFLPPPSTVQVGGSPLYKIGRKLGEGGFAQVFVGHCIGGLSGRSVGPDEIMVLLGPSLQDELKTSGQTYAR